MCVLLWEIVLQSNTVWHRNIQTVSQTTNSIHILTDDIHILKWVEQSNFGDTWWVFIEPLLFIKIEAVFVRWRGRELPSYLTIRCLMTCPETLNTHWGQPTHMQQRESTSFNWQASDYNVEVKLLFRQSWKKITFEFCFVLGCFLDGGDGRTGGYGGWNGVKVLFTFQVNRSSGIFSAHLPSRLNSSHL